MRRFLIVVVLCVVGITGLGFYQGWFRLSSDSGDQKSKVTLTVDRERLTEDKDKAKETVHDLGDKAKETVHQLGQKVKGTTGTTASSADKATDKGTDKGSEAERQP